jgi:hypothetical protein
VDGVLEDIRLGMEVGFLTLISKNKTKKQTNKKFQIYNFK